MFVDEESGENWQTILDEVSLMDSDTDFFLFIVKKMEFLIIRRENLSRDSFWLG